MKHHACTACIASQMHKKVAYYCVFDRATHGASAIPYGANADSITHTTSHGDLIHAKYHLH